MLVNALCSYVGFVFQTLLLEAESGKFPESNFLQRLKSVIHEAEVCIKVAQQLVSTKRHRTRLEYRSNTVVDKTTTSRQR